MLSIIKQLYLLYF